MNALNHDAGMTMRDTQSLRRRVVAREWLILFAILVGMLLASKHSFAAAPPQRSFATADEAVAALVAATRANDATAFRAILGNDPGDLSSGDPVADRALRQAFVAAYDTKHALVPAGDALHLTLGSDDFPFAFPLVKHGQRWRFDTVAGRDELLARRVGRNELDAIEVLRAIVDAQREYASVDRNGNGVLEYARRFASTPGKRDGLYWPTAAGEPPSPLGQLVAHAAGEGYRGKPDTATPYHGYYFRMLRGQGASAAGGALDYVVHGRTIGGFAVVASPAKYGGSGIMTFIVNQDGIVYQADLGPDTRAKATALRRFDPGSGWTRVTSP